MDNFFNSRERKASVIMLAVLVPLKAVWGLIWILGRELLIGIFKFFGLATLIICGPILLILLVTELYFLPSEMLLKRRMRKAGRYLSPVELRRSVATGTLILDSPTCSWAIGRLWYTPDDVLAIAPVQPPSPDEALPTDLKGFHWHPFDRWCCNRYLSPKTGSAKLVGVWHSSQLGKQLANELRLTLVHSWSGAEHLEHFSNQDGSMPPAESGNQASEQ